MLTDYLQVVYKTTFGLQWCSLWSTFKWFFGSSVVFLVQCQHIHQSTSLGNMLTKSFFYIFLIHWWKCWPSHWWTCWPSHWWTYWSNHWRTCWPSSHWWTCWPSHCWTYCLSHWWTNMLFESLVNKLAWSLVKKLG